MAETRDSTRSSATQPISRSRKGANTSPMISYQTRRDLSDRINAIHQGGYEIEHATSDEDGNVLIVFRKIPRAEESAPPAGTTPSN